MHRSGGLWVPGAARVQCERASPLPANGASCTPVLGKPALAEGMEAGGCFSGYRLGKEMEGPSKEARGRGPPLPPGGRCDRPRRAA